MSHGQRIVPRESIVFENYSFLDKNAARIFFMEFPERAMAGGWAAR
jgi:hypothetical protein